MLFTTRLHSTNKEQSGDAGLKVVTVSQTSTWWRPHRSAASCWRPHLRLTVKDQKMTASTQRRETDHFLLLSVDLKQLWFLSRGQTTDTWCHSNPHDVQRPQWRLHTAWIQNYSDYKNIKLRKIYKSSPDENDSWLCHHSYQWGL